MTSQYSRRKILSFLGGSGLLGSAHLLTGCGTVNESSNVTTETTTRNSCTLVGVDPPVSSGKRESIASNLMRTNLDNQAATFRNSDRFYPNRVIRKGATTKVLSNYARSLCNLQYSYYGFNFTLKDYFSRHRAAGLLILKNGQIALEQYAMGNSESSRWTSFSVAKSVTSTLIGAAVHEGAISSVDDTVQTYLSSFKSSAYAETTIKELLSMTSGMAWSENYVARGRGSLNSLLDAAKTNNSENVLSVMRNCKRAVPAGAKFNYNTGETYLLGAILEAATRRKLSNYFSDTIATPMGMETDGYWILDAFNGLEMGGGNISATLRDYGRFGQFFLNDGKPGHSRVLPLDWRVKASQPSFKVTEHGSIYPNYPLGYGYQWWSFPTGQNAINRGLAIHDGAFTAQGIYGQLLYINPLQDAVVVVWSAWPTIWTGAAEFETYSLIAAALNALS